MMFTRHPHLLPLLLLLAVAALLRIASIGSQWSQLERDPDAYRRIAENLVQRGTYSTSPDLDDPHPSTTAFRPPLYPLSLALVSWQGVVRPVGVATLHVVLGVITVLLSFWLARAWRLERYSYLAALLVAADPILLNQSSQVMTETLATMLAVMALLALTKCSNSRFSFGSALLAGTILGLASLCRPTFLVFAAFCLLNTVADSIIARRAIGQRIAQAAAMAVAVVIVLLPWGYRNQRAVGKFIVTTTHGGYTLLLGNNRFFYRHLLERPWGEVWDAAELQQELARDGSRAGDGDEHRELTQDRHDYQLARQTIRDQPYMFAYASLVRIGRLWTPLAHRLTADESAARRLMRYAVAVWYLVALVAAVVGVATLRSQLCRTPWVWGLLLCGAFTAVHSVYWSNMRMRAPLMPAVYLLAVGALAARSAGGAENLRQIPDYPADGGVGQAGQAT